MTCLDNEWTKFLINNDIDDDDFNFNEDKKLSDEKIYNIPKSSDLYISTKTVIAYINHGDLPIKSLFWKIPTISYSNFTEGIIKKQIKFATNIPEELEEVKEKLNTIDSYYEEQIIEHIDNPTGRIKFKDQRKISIGICKKDIVSHRIKPKRAFFNCIVLIFRIIDDGIFKEMLSNCSFLTKYNNSVSLS